jgi:transcriptional/translational regulatory protein YebC/TACO1
MALRPQDQEAAHRARREVALNLAEALDDHDDVQNVYADFDISDEELASLAGAG